MRAFLKLPLPEPEPRKDNFLTVIVTRSSKFCFRPSARDISSVRSKYKKVGVLPMMISLTFLSSTNFKTHKTMAPIRGFRLDPKAFAGIIHV